MGRGADDSDEVLVACDRVDLAYALEPDERRSELGNDCWFRGDENDGVYHHGSISSQPVMSLLQKWWQFTRCVQCE